MNNDSPIINILTYKLPFKLSNQIYNEYQSRLSEARYLIDNYQSYKKLIEHVKLVELLLSLSIFNKRVIMNLDAAVKFHGTVSRKSETDTIKIGKYELNTEEKNKLLGVVMNYKELIKRFSIPGPMMEYDETRDLLKSLIRLKSELEYAENKKRNNRKSKDGEEDIPF